MSTKLRKFGPRLTVSLTTADYERLNAIAEEQDASVSWVLRRAVEDYLAKISGRHEEEKTIQYKQKSGNKNRAA